MSDFAERMADIPPPEGMTRDDLYRLGELVDARIDEARVSDRPNWPDWLNERG